MSTGTLVDFQTLDKDVQELLRESVAARESAYCPYSKFKCGAALRCADGAISRGCNVENASYPVGTCAERGAIARAVCDGKQKFSAIAVVADTCGGRVSTPCGMCRQALMEFGDVTIYAATPDLTTVMRTSAQELLPLSFSLDEHDPKST